MVNTLEELGTITRKIILVDSNDNNYQ
jgi:hypothetical protein